MISVNQRAQGNKGRIGTSLAVSDLLVVLLQKASGETKTIKHLIPFGLQLQYELQPVVAHQFYFK